MTVGRFTALRVAVCVLALAVVPAAAEQATSNWGARERAKHAAEQDVLRQREQQALQAREKAAAARQYALQLNDQQALPIAERAVLTADRAVERIRAARARSAARLAAVERIDRQPGSGTRAMASTLRGTVEVKTAAGWQRLTPDTALQPGEEIRTGPDGFAEVMFNDGSRINLHGNTSFVLASEDAAGATYRLSAGRLKAQVDRALRQRPYAINTPVAAVAVRGTDFLLDIAPDGASELVVLQGEVDFGPLAATTRTPVRQGERAVLGADGTLRGPLPVDLKALSPWWD